MNLWSWIPYEFHVCDSAFATMFDMFKSFVTGTLFTRNIPNRVTWFLFALFYCKVFCDSYYKYKLGTLFTIFFLLIISFFAKMPFWLGQGAVAFSFYLIGHLLKKWILEIPNFPKRIMWVVVLLITTIFLSNFNGKVSIFSLTFGNLSRPINYFIFYINALVGSTMLLLLSSFINKKNILVSFFSGSLMSILVLQMFFISTSRTIYGDDLPSLSLAFVYTIIIMVICVLFDKIYTYVKIQR